MKRRTFLFGAAVALPSKVSPEKGYTFSEDYTMVEVHALKPDGTKYAIGAFVDKNKPEDMDKKIQALGRSVKHAVMG